MITLQELESRLWAAANRLRGPVDPSDFKAYILPLLFYKRLSDGWDEEHARALADYGGDETLAAQPENHRFAIPDGCHWRDLRDRHSDPPQPEARGRQRQGHRALPRASLSLRRRADGRCCQKGRAGEAIG